jgi:hypothetical protein
MHMFILHPLRLPEWEADWLRPIDQSARGVATLRMAHAGLGLLHPGRITV